MRGACALLAFVNISVRYIRICGGQGVHEEVVYKCG